MDKNERLTEYFFQFLWNISRWFHMWFSLRFLFQLEFFYYFFLLLCTRNDKNIQPGNYFFIKNFRWRRCWRLLRGNFVGVLHNIYFNEYQMCEFLHILNDIINVSAKIYFYLQFFKCNYNFNVSQINFFISLWCPMWSDDDDDDGKN